MHLGKKHWHFSSEAPIPVYTQKYMANLQMVVCTMAFI